MIKTLVYIYLGLIINFIHDKREKEEDGCFQNADDTSPGKVISIKQDMLSRPHKIKCSMLRSTLTDT